MERLNNDLATLKTLCAEQALELDALTLKQLVRYGSLLEEWNHKINLISRKEDAPVIVKHIFHSLLIALFHPFSKGEKVLDLGTGGRTAWYPARHLLSRHSVPSCGCNRERKLLPARP
jgi:16S rRNA (guanine527-N7)-methyltransferase